MHKNSCDKSLLPQLSLCQATPGRPSANTPVSWWKQRIRRGVAEALWLAPDEASKQRIHLYWSKTALAGSSYGGGTYCSSERWTSHFWVLQEAQNQGTIMQLQDKTSSSTKNKPTADPTAKAD